jgi:exodeoxyribonuclease VII small subunit
VTEKQPTPSSGPQESSAAQGTFEEALSQLETIVGQLEEGSIGLAEGLARYEQGVKLLRQCYHLLEQAQNRIELLNRVDSDGNIHCEPFDEGSLSLEQKAQARSRRRSRSPEATPPDESDAMDGPGRLF